MYQIAFQNCRFRIEQRFRLSISRDSLHNRIPDSLFKPNSTSKQKTADYNTKNLRNPNPKHQKPIPINSTQRIGVPGSSNCSCKHLSKTGKQVRPEGPFIISFVFSFCTFWFLSFLSHSMSGRTYTYIRPDIH